MSNLDVSDASDPCDAGPVCASLESVMVNDRWQLLILMLLDCGRDDEVIVNKKRLPHCMCAIGVISCLAVIDTLSSSRKRALAKIVGTSTSSMKIQCHPDALQLVASKSM